jgi:hypothetical protein
MKPDGIIHCIEQEVALAAGEEWKNRSKGIVDLQIHWVPSHSDFAPNEKADEEAKKAAQGDSSDAKSLPKFLRKHLLLSVSVLHQEHFGKIKKRWEHKSSPRENHLRTTNNSAPSKMYIRLIVGLDHRQASILFQFRTGHISLNQHLFRIRKSNTLVCPNFQGITVETVKHFLLDCPFYQRERHNLESKLRCHTSSISFPLSSPVAVLPLLKYVHATGCFKTHFRKELEERVLTNAHCNAELRSTFEQLKKTIANTTKCGHPQ